MGSFTVLARTGCTTHAKLALALTAEFAPLRGERAQLALDELAVWLLSARHDTPCDQLRAVADLVQAHLEALVLDAAIDDLLLDRVVIGGAGHPLLLAVACAEAGRRAALPLAAWSPARTAPSSLISGWPSRCSSTRRRGRCSTRARSTRRCHGSARTRSLRGSSTGSATVPSVSAMSRGRCARPSCAWPCPSSPARVSAWKPICGASGRG
jgi:hypothetical protein